jgi:hypothetical protein
MTFINISDDYPDVIKNKVDKKIMTYKRNIYLKLQRPMTPEENKDFDKISLYLEIQSEIEKNRKRRERLIKEGIFVI